MDLLPSSPTETDLIESTISGRVCKPRRCARKETLHRYLADFQRYEAVACGFAGTSIEKAPNEDIHKMAKKLNAVSLQFSGSNVGQEGVF
jgi:Zn ribbon nucleic-acid-binding protein